MSESRQPAKTGLIGSFVRQVAELDRFDVCCLLTLVLLLLHAPDFWYVRTPVVLMVVPGLVLPRLRVTGTFWLILAALLGSSAVNNWATADNHKWLEAYWTLALAMACFAADKDRPWVLATSAQWLVCLCMGFATLWKLISSTYPDGSFFEYELLTDGRFAHVTAWVCGVSFTELSENRRLAEVLTRGHLDGVIASSVTLHSAEAVRWLALFMTWWTVLIEGGLALVFALPSSRRVDDCRHAMLLLFGATTYALAPVKGFGWLLMIMGLAQCRTRPPHTIDATEGEERPGWAAAYLAAFALIQVYSIPYPAIIRALS